MEKAQKRILLITPTMHGEELKFIQEAFDGNWIAPLGLNCDLFELEVERYLDGKNENNYHALCLSSGTAALHLAYKLAGVKRGDIVLCSDMTFAATVNPIIYEGGIPVFVDSEEETWNMSPEALEKAFKKYPQAKVVSLVHLYGTPAKLKEICEICERHNAILIEDAAETLAATYNGRKVGTFGQYAMFSFNGNKIITTSGGGMLITKDKASREKALFWATQAREKVVWYQHEEIGYNYRMSNIVAGIGRGQLIHLDEHRQIKEKNYYRYAEKLANLPMTMNPHLKNSVPNYWMSCLWLDESSKVAPMDLLNQLNELNIESRPIWKPMHMQPVFESNDFISVNKKPVSEKIFARGLCLPSDIKLTETEQDFVVEAIKSCF